MIFKRTSSSVFKRTIKKIDETKNHCNRDSSSIKKIVRKESIATNTRFSKALNMSRTSTLFDTYDSIATKIVIKTLDARISLVIKKDEKSTTNAKIKKSLKSHYLKNTLLFD